MKNYKIAVAGTGYVGLSLGVLFAQHHQVVAVDIVQAKVDMINNKKSPIQDDYIEKYLAEKDLNLTATLDAKAACARKEKHMEERMMDTIVEIYNHMDDSDKDAFTLEDAEDMVEDQIRMDKEAGREPLAYLWNSFVFPDLHETLLTP